MTLIGKEVLSRKNIIRLSKHKFNRDAKRYVYIQINKWWSIPGCRKTYGELNINLNVLT